MRRIIDTTLREGEQTPGVSFTLQQRKRIIDGLCRIGIKEIEIGIASSLTNGLPELISYCRRKKDRPICSVWCRCLEKDIRLVADMGPDIIALSLPVSDLLLAHKIGRDRIWARAALQSSIVLARQLGMNVTVGLEDATRADERFLLEMASLAGACGALRIRLADTVGISTPAGIARLVQKCTGVAAGCRIGVHTHNDFGMATANALSALESGAETADVTVLGLGERTGCARLEEVVGYLALVASVNFRTEALQPLSRYVATITKRQISANRPLLGKDIFTCETGLHLQGLQNDPRTYEPFPPERVGANRKLILGAKTGRRALTNFLMARGCRLESEFQDKDMEQLRRLFQENNLVDAEEVYTKFRK